MEFVVYDEPHLCGLCAWYERVGYRYCFMFVYEQQFMADFAVPSCRQTPASIFLTKKLNTLKNNNPFVNTNA